MKINPHPLMKNNIIKDDLSKVIAFLKKDPILTQSKKCEEFEKLWSKWLGVKYSVFVNSGSSANYLTLFYLSRILKKKSEIIVPALTWNSDIVSVIRNNFEPIFVDIDLKNLAMNEDQVIKKINKKTAAVFITHAQGFNGLSQKLINYIKRKNIYLIEDVCESHGATFKNKKLGTFGNLSNFSFYYAHHLSTIEGGMVCMNDKKAYNFIKMARSHGLLRSSNDKNYINKISKKFTNLNSEFIFQDLGFNMRNNEISAVIGINQIPRLNKNIKKRNKNFKFFLKNIEEKLFFKNYDMKGISNYAFPLILKNKSFKLRDKLEKILKNNKIEFRRGNAGGGNQLKQPYLRDYLKKNKKNINLNSFSNVNHVHDFGYYIGNYPDLSLKNIKKICDVINSL